MRRINDLIWWLASYYMLAFKQKVQISSMLKVTYSPIYKTYLILKKINILKRKKTNEWIEKLYHRGTWMPLQLGISRHVWSHAAFMVSSNLVCLVSFHFLFILGLIVFLLCSLVILYFSICSWFKFCEGKN